MSDDLWFGRLAVLRGLLQPGDLDRADRELRSARADGRDVSLDEVLVGLGLLTPSQVLELEVEVWERHFQQSGSTTGFARYQAVEEIARGGMGIVYRAIDPEFQRPVAIKVAPDGLPQNRSQLARFYREARITGRLQHPAIPPVHEMGQTDDGRPYFTMPLLAGRSLESILDDLRQGQGDPIAIRPLLVRSLIKACEGLSYAHARGVIHRDLKPGNLQIGEHGEVLILDWGIAKVVDTVGDEGPLRRRLPGESLVTIDGTVLGTPAYMPPEQAAGDLEAIDARSDVYSMGAVLYETLTLGRPYPEKNLPQLLIRIREGRLEPPSARAPAAGIRPAYDEIVRRAMAARPADRLGAVEDLAERLEAALHQDSAPARRSVVDSFREAARRVLPSRSETPRRYES